MEEQHRVIIIGAGLAGLACGKFLRENGFDDFAIVEGLDRIGGRCQTVPLGNHVLELGAESLDGEPANNPLYRLADEYQLAEMDDSGSDRDECYHDEDAESIDEDVVDEMRRIYDEILEKKVPTYPYENYPDLSLGEFVSAEFEQYLQAKLLTLDQEEIDERRKVIHWLNKQHPHLTNVASNKLTDVSVQDPFRAENITSSLRCQMTFSGFSCFAPNGDILPKGEFTSFTLLLGWISLERLPKDPQHEHEKIFLRQGFHDLFARAFLEKISFDRIHLNTSVQRVSIHEEEQYVTVEVLNKSNQQAITYRAQHVVCTQSIGCLKQTMHQMFVPALPHPKRMCIQRLGFGTINKIYLVFSQPFWDVDFDAFHFLWDLNRLSTEWKLKCFAQTSFDGRWCKSITGFSVHQRLANVLTTEISGEAAKYVETIPDDLLGLAFQELLCQFYPDNPSPKPQQVIRSRWFSEPFINGSHTFIKLGSSIHDIKQLAQPWPNKPDRPLILFAGEGTHERFYGTAHGALMTGVREAKRLLEVYKSNRES